ncbi:MAG: HAD family phosphatase [Candidatus Woesearchaeota archaeon]
MEIVWQSFNEVLKPYGIHFGEKDIRKYLGYSLRDQLRVWKQKYGIELDFAEFANKSGRIQYKLIKEQVRVESGLTRLLDDLKRNRAPIEIATNWTRESTEKILDILKIHDYFLNIVTAYEVPRHKPYPDIYRTASKKIDMKPASCIVFEDSADGVRAAKAAGMKCIGKLHKYNSARGLHEADLLISSFSEVNYDKLAEMAK